MKNHQNIIRSIFLFISLFLAVAISAQTPPSGKVDHARELDFMLGDWNVAAKILTSQVGYISGTGTMKVTFDQSTLLAEMRIKFQNFESNGTTKRKFDNAKGMWDVSWNPVGQPPVLNIEGQMKDGRFIEIDYGRDNRGSFIGRLVVFNMAKDHFSVRKDKIYDDGMIIPEIWMYEAVRTSSAGR